MTSRKLKTKAKHLLRAAFESLQPLGIDILPRHFYSEIPNIRELKSSTQWRQPFSMVGISCDISNQLEFVRNCTAEQRDALPRLGLLKKACEINGSDEGFGPVEADFLYCFLLTHKPKVIVQVGCGVSTAVCLMAAQSASYKPKIICVEPYPTDFLRRAASDGTIQLIERKLQDVFADLPTLVGAGDLFFVDSSHTLGPTGEVTRIILEILPRLTKGAFVHFHDIGFPYDYGAGLLAGDLFFPHETALLMAFLTMNNGFRIEASFSMLHHRAQDELRTLMPTFTPAPFTDGLSQGPGHHPSSIYLRVC